jgi:hypothetical protein
MAHLHDPKLPDMSDASRREPAIERIWSEPRKSWVQRQTNVVIADGYFEKGAMRAAFKMKFVDDAVRGDGLYVAKLALRTQDRKQEQVLLRACVSVCCAPGLQRVSVRKGLQDADDCRGIRQGVQQAVAAQARRVSRCFHASGASVCLSNLRTGFDAAFPAADRKRGPAHCCGGGIRHGQLRQVCRACTRVL